MESSSMPSMFRFRDHRLREFPNSTNSDPSSEVSSVLTGSDRESEPEIASMTGRGIKHLCSELLELKAAASEHLEKNILANYSSFVRVLEEVKGVEQELVQLENHFENHKRLVKDLVDCVFTKILSEETINATFEDHIDDVPSVPSELEAHINDVSENLDTLLSENRIEEALDLLELEDEYYQSRKFEDYSPDSEIMLHNSMISERKSMLILQLTQIAENRRTAGPELQKALAGLCRLGETQLAVRLLLKYYHLHILAGTHNMQSSKSSSNRIYIRELARFVFSMISQVAKIFVILCGKTSPYSSELMLWACEETKSFSTCFENYVKCISEISGGLSNAIKALQVAVSYCSLLENQTLVLQPYLVKHLCPCMEEVLHLHINHFKKVIAIFSASDHWVLERYLVSGIFGGESSSLAIDQQPEFCMLTTSGRKFLTLLQAIIEDISPLVALQMGSSVVNGLTNLFTEYVIILERALTEETCATEKDGPRINLAESLPQQVSILANLSTLVLFLSIMVKSIFSGIGHMDSQSIENSSIVNQQKELDDFLLLIEESSNKLRSEFCQQFIIRLLSTYHSYELITATHYNDQCDANTIQTLMPSAVFQGLFLELRKLEQLQEEMVFEVNWLMGLLRELMESMFIWVSKNNEIHATTKENISLQPDEANQFVLDVQFLVEIGMYEGYFSDDPLLLLTLMKSTFNSAGLNPFRDFNNDGWAIDVATTTIQKLLEIEKTISAPEVPAIAVKGELNGNQTNQSACACNISQEDDDVYAEAKVAKDEWEDAIDAETASLDMESSPREGSFDLPEIKRDYVDKSTLNLRQPTIQLDDAASERAADAEQDELAPTSSMEKVGENCKETKSKPDEYLSNIPVEGSNSGKPGTEVVPSEDSVEMEDFRDSAEFEFDEDNKQMVCADTDQLTAVASAFMHADVGDGEVVSKKALRKNPTTAKRVGRQ